MNLSLTTLCLVALATPFSVKAAAGPLEDRLPASTTVIVSIANFPEMEKQCKDGPLSDLVNNQQIRSILKPCTDAIMSRIEEDKKDELISWTEVKTHLTGQIVLGLDITKLSDELKAQSGKQPDPSVTLLANVKDGDGLVALVASSLKEASTQKDSECHPADTESFMGVDIHHVVFHNDQAEKTANAAAEEAANAADGAVDKADAKPEKAETKPVDTKNYDTNLYFGNVGDTVFAAIDADTAKAAVEALKGNDKGTMADGDPLALTRLHAQTDKLDAYFYFNAKPLTDLAEAAIRKGMKNDDAAQPDPTKPTADAVIKALGLDSVKSVLAGVKFDADSVHMNAALNVDISYGVGRLLRAYGDSYVTPDFVPDATTKAVASASFNLSTLVMEIKQIVFSAYPTASFIYQAQVAQIQQKNGIDFDKDLLGNFGDGLVSFTIDNPDVTKVGAEATVQIFALKINDPATFERSLLTVLSMTPMGPMVQKSDYMGCHLMTIPMPGSGAKSITVTTKDGWALISSEEAAVHSVISTDTTKKTFWQSARYTNLGDGKLAPGGVAMSFCDFDFAVHQFLYGFAQVYNTKTKDAKDGKTNQIDTSLIDSIKDLPYTICSKTYKVPEGIKFDAYLIKK